MAEGKVERRIGRDYDELIYSDYGPTTFSERILPTLTKGNFLSISLRFTGIYPAIRATTPLNEYGVMIANPDDDIWIVRGTGIDTSLEYFLEHVKEPVNEVNTLGDSLSDSYSEETPPYSRTWRH